MKALLTPPIIFLSFFLAVSVQAETTSNTSNTTKIDSLILQLAEMKTDTLDDSADAFWQLVVKGEESIHGLAAHLSDTTPTNIYHGCKGSNLTLGELCFFALDEIADFPAAYVMHMQYCVIELKEGFHCFGFYNTLFNSENKSVVQQKIRTFYEETEFEFYKLQDKYLTASQKANGIKGKYRMKESH